MRCARIDGINVVNIEEWPQCPAGCEVIPAGFPAGIGWTYEGGEFKPPEVAELEPVISIEELNAKVERIGKALEGAGHIPTGTTDGVN